MDDQSIRIALKKKILSHHVNDPASLVLDEFGLEYGAARIDLILINSALHGFEIKSDKDTLYRLPHQMSIYNLVLDKVTLVVGYKHAYEALQIVPIWWGVKLAEMGPRGGVYFTDARSPRKNPNIDPNAIVRLLWKKEAMLILHEVGEATGFHSKPREKALSYLVDTFELEELRFKVRTMLMARNNLQFAT